MAVRRRGKKWEVSVEAGRDPVTHKRRRVVESASTKREAERREAEIRIKLEQGRTPARSRITVADLADRWLEAKRPEIRLSTSLRYELSLRRHVVPRIGHLKLRELRPDDIEALYGKLANENGRLGRKLSARSIVNVHRPLAEALNWAVGRGWIAANPCALVKPPRPAAPNHRVLTFEQAVKLRAAALADESAAGAAVVLALTTGMRMGEVLALRWEDVDFEGRAVRVTGSLRQLAGHAPERQEPKTAKGRRYLRLAETDFSALRAQKARQAQLRLLAGPAWLDYGFVFTRADGSTLRGDALRDTLTRLLKRAGLRALRFHELGLTHASLRLAADVHPTYSHLLPGLQEQAVIALDARMNALAQTDGSKMAANV
jgi:integrase